MYAAKKLTGLPHEGLRGVSLEDHVKAMASLPLVNHPGEVFNYAKALDVAGRVIEVVSGMPLPRFFAERVFGPLGMVDSGFTVPASKVSLVMRITRALAMLTTAPAPAPPDPPPLAGLAFPRYARPIRCGSAIPDPTAAH